MKWTKDIVEALAKQHKGPSDFKKAHPSAYKALRRYGLLNVLWPIESRERKPRFTSDILMELMQSCTSRSDFQVKHPSAYNAARKLGIIPLGIPRSRKYDLFAHLPYTDAELIEKCKSYKTIKEFSEAESGAYQVACRKGFLDLYGPPKMQGTSLAEIELLEFLQSLNSDFKTRRFANDYELDCYSESLKLGVEYNGFYWHSEANRGRSYHRAKTQYFENMGIRVIHIWEDEWKNRKEQVKDFLRSACGKNQVRIGARKCDFRTIEKEVARNFLDAAHIQGGIRNISVAIGCFYLDKLIGVATFGTHHRNNNDTVLNRFACLPDYTISGFLAKATKIAYKEFGPLLSWADYSKSQARGYLAAGWIAIKTHPPDYFYVNSKGERVSKQSRKKSNAGTPAGMTEAQHAAKDGLYRIWDCGKILLQYKQIS